MIEGEVVTAIRTLADRGVGKKTIAREVGVALNTVRRYLRQPIAPGRQIRPAGRRLTDERREEARRLYVGRGGQCGRGPAAARRAWTRRQRPHAGARGRGHSTGAPSRGAGDGARRNPPGDQMQIDFGQKRLRIAGVRVRIFLLVAVLSYSRRLFVKAFLNERGADWRDGIAAALHAFRRRAAHAARGQCPRRWSARATARPAR